MTTFRGILKGRNKNNSKSSEPSDMPFPYHPEDNSRVTYFFTNPDAISSFASCHLSESLSSDSYTDIHSESSSEFSSMATCTDNPGPGRTLDTHVFQPLGRLVEKALARYKPKICVEQGSADKSDRSSDSSSDFSTTATRTNNPGPGRIIDTHFYQPCGRYIERILTNIEQKYFRTPQWNADHILRHLNFPLIPIPDSILRIDSLIYTGNLQASGLEHTPKDDLKWQEWYHSKFKPFKDAIFQSQSVTKAFRRLLIQARGDKRHMRVEAQKQLWRLCRHYEYMLIMIDVLLGKDKLVRDADTTFIHCSIDDLDNNFQFQAKWISRLNPHDNLVDYKAFGAASYALGDPELRNILKLCSHNRRRISSAQLNYVLETFSLALVDISNLDKDPAVSSLEDIYICLFLIIVLTNGHLPLNFTILPWYLGKTSLKSLNHLLVVCRNILRRREDSSCCPYLLDLVAHLCILSTLIVPEIARSIVFSKVFNCVVKALVDDLMPSSKNSFFAPYIGVGNYLSNLRQSMRKLEDFNDIMSRPVAFPFEDYKRGHHHRSLTESYKLDRKWADENWEWVVIYNHVSDDRHYSCVPFRRREMGSYPDYGALRSHFDYKTFRRVLRVIFDLRFYYYHRGSFCVLHENRLWWMISEWLKDLNSFSILHSDYPLGTDIRNFVESWQSISFNPTPSDRCSNCDCTFCIADKEARVDWKRNIEDRLAILKLSAPSHSSFVGASAEDTAPSFSPLPIECGHGAPLSSFDYSNSDDDDDDDDSDDDDDDSDDDDDNEDDEEDNEEEREEEEKREESVRKLPCLVDVIGNIGLPDLFRNSHSGYRKSPDYAHQCAGAAKALSSKDVSQRCAHGDRIGHHRGTPTALDSEIIEKGPILGSVQSLEEAVNMIYASTMQGDQATAASAIVPRPLSKEAEASLIAGMYGLNIQKRKRGRPQRPSLVRDLLNPTTERQFENSPYELWTSTCEVNSLSVSSMDEGAEGFDGWGMGRQAVQMVLADSDAEFLGSDIILSYPSYQRRLSSRSEGSRTLYFGTKGEFARPDSPCLCRICERSRCIARKERIVATRTQPLTSFTVSPPRFEAGPAQTEVERVPAVSCSPFRKEAGVDDLLLQEERSSPQPEVEDSQVHKSSPHLGQKRSFSEETAQYGSNLLGQKKRKTSHTRNAAVHFPGSETSTANELATLPEHLKRADDLSRGRFEDGHIRKISFEEDAETESLQPRRKKQKFLHNFEDTSSSSDTDSTTTETNESADAKSEGDMSADEDFRFAKTRLSLLSIQ